MVSCSFICGDCLMAMRSPARQTIRRTDLIYHPTRPLPGGFFVVGGSDHGRRVELLQQVDHSPYKIISCPHSYPSDTSTAIVFLVASSLLQRPHTGNKARSESGSVSLGSGYLPPPLCTSSYLMDDQNQLASAFFLAITRSRRPNSVPNRADTTRTAQSSSQSDDGGLVPPVANSNAAPSNS